MQDDVVGALPFHKGHFVLESGHHTDTWLDLELLCVQPQRIHRLAGEIAARLSKYGVQGVCGPLVEGAFVALMVASHLGVPFTYAERWVDQDPRTWSPVRYRIPHALRGTLRGKRVAIVDDVINAGSAVSGTFADLQVCGAEPVAVAALAVLGQRASTLASERRVGLEALTSVPNEIWGPAECPLCAQGIALTER